VGIDNDVNKDANVSLVSVKSTVTVLSILLQLSVLGHSIIIRVN
jgi:hypothetical protein